MVATGVPSSFEQSVHRQIQLNQSRTPTERFVALCDLLDFARAMAPKDEQACERRSRALAARNREREQWREQCRRILASQRIDASASI
jgi:hypothetical protein